jgi:hypothetical protein
MKVARKGAFFLLQIAFYTCFFFRVSGQKERVFLDLDSYTARAGQGIFFKAYITRGLELSRYSSDLYVNVYSKSGEQLSQQVFPIVMGLSKGQIFFTDSVPTANYYVVAYTRAQLNYPSTHLFSVPVLVYNQEKLASVSLQKPVPYKNTGTSGVVNHITWVTRQSERGLSSSLAIDSTSSERHLVLVAPGQGNPSLEAELSLSNSAPQKQGLFAPNRQGDIQPFYLYEDSTLIGRQFIKLKDLKQNVDVVADSLDLLPYSYNSLEIRMPDSAVYYTSISIEDADRSSDAPLFITSLHDSYTEDLTLSIKDADTSYISFSGTATRLSGKNITDELSKEIFLAGIKDTSYLFTKTVSINEKGKFRLDSLIFFDSLALQFQVNKPEDGRTKDLKLNLTRNAPPSIDASSAISAWQDEPAPFQEKDIAYTKKEKEVDNLTKMKFLHPAIVKGRKDMKKELDHTYASGSFSEPALYSYDLRNYNGEYNRDIFSYIDAQGGRLRYDRVGDTLQDPLGHCVHYYVNEIQYDHLSLRMFDFSSIAYVKILESDFLPVTKTVDDIAKNCTGFGKDTVQKLKLHLTGQQTPVNVLIYTRKGKDFRSMPGGLNTVFIKGYDRILPFTPDNRTLCWRPWEKGHNFRIHFNNSESCSKIRVKVSGITADGRIAWCEKVFNRPASSDYPIAEQKAPAEKVKFRTESPKVITSATGDNVEVTTLRQD